MQQFNHSYCTRYLRLILMKFRLSFFLVMDIVSMALPLVWLKSKIGYP